MSKETNKVGIQKFQTIHALMRPDDVISLLTDSNDSDDQGTSASTSVLNGANLRSQDVQSQGLSPSYRSCSLRAFNYMMSLDLGAYADTYLSQSESSLLSALMQVISVLPRSASFLSVLLARKWPKWHVLRTDDPADVMAIEALVSVGCVSTSASTLDWSINQTDLCSLDPVTLLDDFPHINTSKCFLDLLLYSLSPKLLSQLIGSSKQTLSRTNLITKLKSAFDGTQRTIFGDSNNTSKLIKLITGKLESENSIALFLSPTARRLFSILSFVLDLDAEEDVAWDMALPDTLLKTFANVSGRRSPRLSLGHSWNFSDVPLDLRIHTSRQDVNEHRAIGFLQDRVINRKIDAAVIARNVRLALDRVNFDPSDLRKPEWWRRRQIPRRLSNLLWKCISEIERSKQYEIAKEHLEFLLKHNEHLLGKKRLGKILIRFMICAGHVSEDVSKVNTIVSEFFSHGEERSALYPADVAELTRRISGISITKYEWPCGGICEREVVIPGAKSRQINWVEQAAIEHYYVTSEGGYENGVHCEGRVMMEIFSALFKDSVLAPDSVSTESGLLQSPLQKWALDVGFLKECSDARWKDALDVIEGFSSLDYDALADFYCTLNSDKEETNDPLPVIEILKCMRGNVLGAIMRLMIADPYYWGGGQPDLIVWNTTTREVCFAEVKGPGDQLSPRQRWWLANLRDAGATAEVCWVVDEPKTKISRRKEVQETVVSKKRHKKKTESPRVNKISTIGFDSHVEIIELSLSSQE